jgi:dihydroorotase
MSECDLLLRDVHLPDGRVADISIRDGRVLHTGAPRVADRTVPCCGCYVLPGAVDMHVHMRGGIQSNKEDWESGSRAAIAGGVTIVVDQPNAVPPISSPARLIARVADAREHSLCSFCINAVPESPDDMPGLSSAGAMAFGELFAAASSYGNALSPDQLSMILGRAGPAGALVTIHAEEPSGISADTLAGHDLARPPGGEVSIVGRISRTAPPGSRLHFCHLSTADAVLAATGTVEVTPHHLLISIEQRSPDDTFAKVNPPVRTERERKRLWEVFDQIDVIASDHAPHTIKEKEVGFSGAPSGIPGVETMVPLLLGAMTRGLCTVPDIMRLTSTAPARILGIPEAGFDPGSRADFAVYPREYSKVDPALLHSRAGWSPFEGFEAIFPHIVIAGGCIVYEEGEFDRCEPRWYPGRGYIARAPM